MHSENKIKASLHSLAGWSFAILAAVTVVVISLYWHREMGQIPEIFMGRFSVKQTALLAAVLWGFGTCALFGFRLLSKKHYALCALSVILGTGLFIAVFSPVINGFDEQSHLFKTIASLDGKMFDYESYNYEISDSYLDFWYNVLNPWYSPIFRGTWKETTTFVQAADFGFAQPTYPVYGYLFCMLGFGIARALHLSAGICFAAGRITNLLGYAGLIGIAFLLLPQNACRFKNALALYAGFPPLLFVAAHYTQDGVVYGLVAILLAMFVRMLCLEKVSSKLFLGFAVILVLLGPLKYPYVSMGLLLFAIPREKYSVKKPYLKILLLAVLALAVCAVWYFFVSSQFHENRVSGVDGMQQVRFMLTHPLKVIMGGISTMLVMTAEYFQRFFRLCGGLNYYVTTGFSLILCIANLFVLTVCGSEFVLKNSARFWVFLTYFGVSAITVFAIYVSFNTVGETRFYQGIQGRYFYGIIPLIPMLLPKLKIAGEQEEKEEPYMLTALSFLLLECCAFMTSMGVLI